MYKMVLAGGDGSYRSLYRANPQVYRIGERIECPAMFVYRGEPGHYESLESPGSVMLEVEAEDPWDEKFSSLICDAINGHDHRFAKNHGHVSMLEFLNRNKLNPDRDMSPIIVTLTNALTPIRELSLEEANAIAYGADYAPALYECSITVKEVKDARN